MDRREALKRTALYLGFAVSAPAATAILNGCVPAGRQRDWTPTFLTADEAALVEQLTETILPATDNLPGALDVGVPEFIDLVLHDCYPPQDQTAFRNGLADLDARSKENYGNPFVDASGQDQLELVNQLKKETESLNKTRKYEPERSTPFFSTLLELTVSGYLSSEQIGEQVLAYDPIPQEYNGCFEMEPGQRLWSL